ncbi:haloacid dehalogenase superfamily, subfamily IA, variant 3 with third motif having DD or ED/haloacid dehalogenase superfamily, subfamily IA, variant 1 with third motif having Dx(3-4)D or Dx(3-4)E [Raineyella antarctica]|uniref:Haloacid dehalogenase superfamily, subfamily IA, variant 3 with third motif having DD or ED/haloacid dehalogenase superfamily, subfamily IA, variant 1 with third motif having Dx(3-4)D or Dx(3-4)E n=1 Tax=Raineyella antarctica TaxID=1577474 RepID=A0A1G6GMF0_9ACTN|nr:HAD-IA family hydrolase [Raineyella antarctica]SDB83127.1 haloacid dehalogenase superfamily, subfamily IA, variant 3 with third motif having DD or ED/haloacid dehalogenase superfamily, subfamily IA, variant 1 with third motif having Dx(3-4)D or Dx(3-4)E [Raineyella antarctica]
MRYHSIVWDMGGTLIDTYPSVDRTLARVVRAHGEPIEEDLVARLTRRAIAVAIDELSERYGVPHTDLDAAYARLKRSWTTTPPPVMAGAREVLSHVRSVGGRNIVVTNRDRTSASALLAATGLDVDDLVCASDGFPRKPDPQMYRAVLDRNGLDPADCLAVGDRAIDAVASRQVGLDCVILETPGIPVVEDGERITDLRRLIDLMAGDQPISPSR